MKKLTAVNLSFACTFAACVTSLPAFAVNEESPLLITVALSSVPISAGEPISVNFNIVNQSSSDISVDVNDGGNYWEDTPSSWFSLQSIDKTGQVKSIGNSVNHVYNGAYSTAKHINTGEALANPTVAIQQFTIQAIGSYDLVVHIQLPYKSGKDEVWKKYTEDVHFPITVTNSDPVLLNNTVSSLYRKYLQETTDAGRNLLLHSLFAMPRASTRQYLRQLAENSQFKDADAMADFLSSENSIESASLLTELCLTHSESKSIIVQLFSLYRGGNDDIKHAIEGVYHDHGQELPPAPAIRVD